MDNDIELSVVVPVYRSAETLVQLADRLRAMIARLGCRGEMIFVDDGSLDDSWQVLCRLQEADPEGVTAIQLMRNFGQHNALMCGFRHARGRLIVTLDDDLQHPPEEIAKLLAALAEQELDLVYGCPLRKKHSLWRNTGSTVVTSFYRLAFHSTITITSFRAMRRQLVESILSYSKSFTFIDGLLAWNTQRIGQVAVEHHPRANGRSGYSLAKLLLLAFNLFTNFSLLPLQLVSGCGLFAAGSGFLAGVYYLVQSFFHNVTVPGYASTIIAVLVLGGMQLLALGILGEYMGRLHLNVNRKPQYVERHVLPRQRPNQALPPKDDAGSVGSNGAWAA
jgi:undecaprenyl-phosphate 4-deoxy-4-formamido-L-arabinose transferase